MTRVLFTPQEEAFIQENEGRLTLAELGDQCGVIFGKVRKHEVLKRKIKALNGEMAVVAPVDIKYLRPTSGIIVTRQNIGMTGKELKSAMSFYSGEQGIRADWLMFKPSIKAVGLSEADLLHMMTNGVPSKYVKCIAEALDMKKYLGSGK